MHCMDVSVVLSTYNRARVVGAAIEALLAQETGGLTYEVLIVDNNSTDNTKQVIESYAQQDCRVKYVFEGKQGVAYGRNAGIALTRGEYIAFCDDDVTVSPTWLRTLYEELLRYPDADFIGGKVLPLWKNTPPAWIDAKMAPLALQDYGDVPLRVSSENPRCLISACLAVRRQAFDRAGLFDPATQRVGNSIGSSEDHDWEMKVWQRGGYGVYVPSILCYAEVPPERQVKSYHRRWHLGNGKFSAIAWRPNFEGGAFQLLGVPAFVYRQLLEAAFSYFGTLIRGDAAEAFDRENNLFFFLGFVGERWKQRLSGRSKTDSAASAGSTPAHSTEPS